MKSSMSKRNSREVEAWVKPGEHCIYTKGEEGAFEQEEGTPALGYVCTRRATSTSNSQEITIKNGNLGFEEKSRKLKPNSQL